MAIEAMILVLELKLMFRLIPDYLRNFLALQCNFLHSLIKFSVIQKKSNFHSLITGTYNAGWSMVYEEEGHIVSNSLILTRQ
ncbi:MAG: hypothetical protein NWE84_09185 [Candidatus Bathyarchaeota archaeon]|nr:hypothetical protein [Candidatus Bathyarchaeota archaeon]